MQFTYPEEASNETSRKRDCKAAFKWIGPCIHVVLIDYKSRRVQNIPHCSEVDKTEDGYLFSVVKEAIC